MKAMFAPLLHVILALAVVVGTASTSSARLSHALLGQAGAQLVICSSEGARLITLDANGNETPAPSKSGCRHCPECALTTTMLPLSTFNMARDGAAKSLPRAQARHAVAATAPVFKLARAPPAQV